jgi:hypothetical protein
MKKEQINLMVGLQKAIENRQHIIKTLKNMSINADNKNSTYSSFNIMLTCDGYSNISDVSNREELKSQIEFLLAYHQVKLEQQQEEMESYILSKKVE